MAISNYSELKTAVANWLARSDLTSRIPEFIDMAESELNDELRAREMITTTNINPSQVNKYVSLPTGFLELIAFNDDFGEPLKEISYEELEERAYSSASARPEYYVIGARIDFERKANASYNFPMRYYQRLDIATDTTNSVLTNWPNLYLYGSLIQAEPYIMNDERMPVWERRYKKALDKANYRATKNKRLLRTEFAGEQFNILRGW